MKNIFVSTFLNSYFIVIYGGKSDKIFKDTKNLALNDFCLYDIPNNKWDTIVTHGFHPISRWGHSMCAIDKEQVLVFGGINLQSYCKSDLNAFNLNPKLTKQFVKKFDNLSKQIKGRLKSIADKN